MSGKKPTTRNTTVWSDVKSPASVVGMFRWLGEKGRGSKSRMELAPSGGPQYEMRYEEEKGSRRLWEEENGFEKNIKVFLLRQEMKRANKASSLA